MTKYPKQLIALSTLIILVGFITYNLGITSVEQMYPEEAAYNYYLNFYRWPAFLIAILAFALSSHLTRRKTWLTILISLALLNGLILVTGMSDTFTEKTEKYLFYFLEVQSTTIVVLVILASFLGHLLLNSKLPLGRGLVTLAVGFSIGAITYFFLSAIPFFEIQQLWFLCGLAILFMIYISYRMNPTIESV